MTHSIGLAGVDGDRTLPAQEGRAIYYPQPPFSAVLAPTAWQKAEILVPNRLHVGLLVKAPDADGIGAIELSAAGYQRHPLSLIDVNATFEANSSAVSIVIGEPAGAVRWVGLFDDNDRLRFYGRILHPYSDIRPASSFDFGEFMLKLKKPQPQNTSGPRPQLGGAQRQSN